MVHKSPIAKDATEFALQLLRDQIGQKVYLTHRLDRKTAGTLLFAKTPEANRTVQQLFQDRQIHKTYQAVVRGFIPDKGEINYPLTEDGKEKEAVTSYTLLERFELPIPSDKFPTSRYSLVELTPATGRFHQLRKHMAHIFHPIIGDRPHGCNKQNRLWKERFGMTSMLLHAVSLSFVYPPDTIIHLKAPFRSEFTYALNILQACNLKK